MPARNRNPIQMSRVSVACLALLVAVCGGYFALVPFLRAIEPSPQFGEVARAKSSSVFVRLEPSVNPANKPQYVANQLRPKRHTPVKPKRPAHKKPVTTVPTRPVLVTRSLPTRTTPTRSHTTTTPTRTHTTPTRTPSKPAPPAPRSSRGPVTGDTNAQGSGLAGRGGAGGSTVTGGVSSTPGHP